MLLVDLTRDGLREAAPVARGCAVRLRAALRVQSLFRRAREGRRAVAESYAARGARPRRAGGTGARRRARRKGRVANARRAAGAGHRGGSRRPRAASSQRPNAAPRRRRSLYQHAPGVDGARAPARRRRRPALGGTHAPYVSCACSFWGVAYMYILTKPPWSCPGSFGDRILLC